VPSNKQNFGRANIFLIRNHSLKCQNVPWITTTCKTNGYISFYTINQFYNMSHKNALIVDLLSSCDKKSSSSPSFSNQIDDTIQFGEEETAIIEVHDKITLRKRSEGIHDVY